MGNNQSRRYLYIAGGDLVFRWTVHYHPSAAYMDYETPRDAILDWADRKRQYDGGTGSVELSGLRPADLHRTVYLVHEGKNACKPVDVIPPDTPSIDIDMIISKIRCGEDASNPLELDARWPDLVGAVDTGLFSLSPALDDPFKLTLARSIQSMGVSM